ncbi:MAG: sulfatase-like hydrolase/transferase, partial [Roseibacillus sp.]|nr:sulfatase-like hydrolase/transferase [Roseibacillus sp.]
VSEDNGPELGCYGEPFVQTPVLDALAAKGVLFQRAYVPQAGCSQSRAALLTGLYPHQNGQIGLATWKFRLYREDTPNVV